MSFSEIKHNLLRTKSDFTQNVRDKFGRSIDSEYFEAILNSLKIIESQEEKKIQEVLEIKQLLSEARSIQPDMGA